MLKLMYITNCPSVALIAEKYGVERIFVDLETLGKQERQGNLDSVKSQHTLDDVAKIKSVLTKSELLVRVNPIYEGSKKEIETAVANGADVVMLPMYKTVDEVARFVDYVGGKAKVCLLLETKEAADCLTDVLKLDGVDEIHIGLNDLHLSLKKKFMFELLADGVVENLCNTLKNANMPFGFGGIAKLGKGALPAEIILGEHYRLGSGMTILSRSFCDWQKASTIGEVENVFATELVKIREYEKELAKKDEAFFIGNLATLKEKVAEIVASI